MEKTLTITDLNNLLNYVGILAAETSISLETVKEIEEVILEEIKKQS